MNMKAMLVQQLMGALILFLNPEVLKKAMDSLLDIIEESVTRSETQLDDVVVLGICAQVRKAFNVPDNDAA
jgi:hypothetical protein